MIREEIIERLHKIADHAVHTYGEIPYVMGLDDGIALQEAVAALSAEPMRWIPVREQMPEMHKSYLVTYLTLKGNLRVKEAYCEHISTTPWVCDWSKKINGEVIAWMPLPKPYESEGQT